MPARRCPYLEEFYRDLKGPLRVYHFDCHVDHRSKSKWALRDDPPICVRNYEDCSLFRAERQREDQVIRRYTE